MRTDASADVANSIVCCFKCPAYTKAKLCPKIKSFRINYFAITAATVALIAKKHICQVSQSAIA
jgi:hypothetical protein